MRIDILSFSFNVFLGLSNVLLRYLVVQKRDLNSNQHSNFRRFSRPQWWTWRTPWLANIFPILSELNHGPSDVPWGNLMLTILLHIPGVLNTSPSDEPWGTPKLMIIFSFTSALNSSPSDEPWGTPCWWSSSIPSVHKMLFFSAKTRKVIEV